MKKILSIGLVLILLVSLAIATTDTGEVLGTEEVVEDNWCDEVDLDEEETEEELCKLRPVVVEEVEELTCKSNEKIVNDKCIRKEGGSGFVLHKNRVLFGLTSNYDGTGWGTHLGWVGENKVSRLHVYRSPLKMIQTVSADRHLGVIVHQKLLSIEDNPGLLDFVHIPVETVLEFLTNNNEVFHLLTFETALEDPKVLIQYEDGTIDWLEYSRNNDRITVILQKGGVLWIY